MCHVRGTWAEGAEEDIWAKKGVCNTRHRKTLLNKELHDCYSATSVVRAMKSRKMRCNAGGGRGAYRDLVGKPKERDNVEVVCIDGRIKTSIMSCRGENLPFCLTLYIIQTVKTEN